MKEEAREYYHFLLAVCRDENIPLVTVIVSFVNFWNAFAVRRCRTVACK